MGCGVRWIGLANKVTPHCSQTNAPIVDADGKAAADRFSQ